jgi:hypothetical protein
MSGHGKSGEKTTFDYAGITYVTTVFAPGQRIPTKTEQALIASGQAVPQASSYIDQFPWTKPAAK